ncbi:host attachment protein [Paracoccus pacificus]|uniref:Host attachment protein n=1 Tax=Paracoccus pacificus TaxID=1463598 RepID=A0ABW4RC42_9RHOB
MMLSHNAFVAVADGENATIFRNTARIGIELEEVERFTPASLANHSGSDLPEGASPKQEDEATFARLLVAHLNKLAIAHKFEELAIIAAPVTLGSMRKHYHKELEHRIVKEVPKSMTHASLAEIAKAVD